MQKKRVNIMCKQCGTEFDVANWQSSGHTTRCEKCRKRHGKTNTRLYQIWENMKQRTTNEKNTSYQLYGAIGIKVCNEWKSFLEFEKWALENGYSDKLSIDRIDVNGNYEPSNCRWVNQFIQSRNVRQVCKNNTTGYKGVYKKRNKFQSKITVNRKQITIGCFQTKEQAAIAYNNYVLENNLEHTLNEVQ